MALGKEETAVLSFICGGVLMACLLAPVLKSTDRELATMHILYEDSESDLAAVCDAIGNEEIERLDLTECGE